MWFTIPDLIASKLLSGKTPQVVRAHRFEPATASTPDLRPVGPARKAPLDPPNEDFFRAVIEQRKRAESRRTPEKPDGQSR